MAGAERKAAKASLARMFDESQSRDRESKKFLLQFYNKFFKVLP